MEMAQNMGMFGPISFEDAILRGAFVEAEVDVNYGGLFSFRIVRDEMPTEIFAEVEVEGAMQTGTWSLEDGGLPALVFESPQMSVSVHNDPSRALIYRSTEGTLKVTFKAAPGVFMVLQNNTVLVVGTGFRGQLAASGPGSISLDQNSLTATLSPGAKVFFRAHPVDGEGAVGSWAQAAIFKAMARERLGAEVFLVGLEGAVMEDVVLYSELALSSRLDAEGRLLVTITRESDASAFGTFVAINMHQAILNVTAVDEIVVELDGTRVERTGNVDELVASPPSTPGHYAAVGENGLFLLVYLSDLSIRTLTIGVEALIKTLTLESLIYVVLGAVVTALAAVALLRRAKREW